MTLPVWVEQNGGTFTARLMGSGGPPAVGATEAEALEALRADLAANPRGKLVMVEFEPPRKSLKDYFGAFGQDSLWKDVAEDIERRREEERVAGFPE